MREFHLLIVDTTQIQSYVFGSNRLRENVGASHLVAMATSDWSFALVQKIADTTNISADSGEYQYELNDKKIEDLEIEAEVLFAGGGNFAVLFRDCKQVKQFTSRLSHKVMEEAPGLQLVIATGTFDWDNPHKNLSALYNRLGKELADKKSSRALPSPLLGLGVTLLCRSTGVPAVGFTEQIRGDEKSIYPASSEILSKTEAAKRRSDGPSRANDRLQHFIPLPQGFAYPSDFDELGRSRGEHSFIGVVHADGDGMGERIRGLGEAYRDNRDYINAIRRFSQALNTCARTALENTVKKLQASIENGAIVHKNRFEELARIELSRRDGKLFLPFRPIVFGGDDVTFVCDGRIALSLAVKFLEEFEHLTRNLPDGKGKATACAGISIVKSHYPFARAYSMAEELCRKAKDYRREFALESSCLDWHFALSGLSGEIEEIRRREYKVKERSLTLRPVALRKKDGGDYRSWPVVRKATAAFQGSSSASNEKEPEWSMRRSKVKALREALRGGPDAVERFRVMYNNKRPLPDLETGLSAWAQKGWHGEFCGYFDAVELADGFIPIGENEGYEDETAPEPQE